MKQETFLWQLGGVTFTAIIGTLLHFLYDWTGLALFAPISAVNESTWEHMKILFFPMLFFAVLQAFFFRQAQPNFWWIKLVGISVGVLLVPILFYTINGAFGKTPDWVNISIFFLSAFVSFLVEYLLFKQNQTPFSSPILPIRLLLFFATTFIWFTYSPPNIPLFLDPVTKKYGIVK